MLDALLAEARVRWGLDPAAGFAVVVAERLVSMPIEPVVPLRPGKRPSARKPASSRRRPTRARRT